MEDIKISLLPLDKIPTCYPDSPVSSVISKVQSSHDGIFVFDKKTNKFLGVVWPYNLLYKQKPFHSTKIKFLIIRPPYITSKTSIYKISEHMLGLKLYSLPIFENEKIIGIITARELMKQILENHYLLSQIVPYLTPSNPLIVPQDSAIKDIYSRMRMENVSRAILVDKQDKLSAVLTRRDIYLSLLSPIGNRQRYKTKSIQSNINKSLMFDEDWIKKLDYQVKSIHTNNILYEDNKKDRSLILERLAKSNIGSIVLIDINLKPTGIISINTFLKALISTKPQPTIPITFTDKKNLISAFRKMEIDDLLNHFTSKINKSYSVNRVDILFDAVRNIKKRVSDYVINLQVMIDSNKLRFNRSKTYYAKTQNHNIRTAVQQAIKKIEHQIMRKE